MPLFGFFRPSPSQPNPQGIELQNVNTSTRANPPSAQQLMDARAVRVARPERAAAAATTAHNNTMDRLKKDGKIPPDAFGPVLAEATAAAIKVHRDIDSAITAASSSASRFASAPNQGGQVISPDAQAAAATTVAQFLHSAVNLNRATGPDRAKALGGDKAVAIAAGLAAGIAAYVDRKPPADPSVSPDINRTNLLTEIRQRTMEASRKAGGMHREAMEATHISILACLILEGEVKGFEQQDRTPANAVDWATAIIKGNPAGDAVISAAMKDPVNMNKTSGLFALARFYAGMTDPGAVKEHGPKLAAAAAATAHIGTIEGLKKNGNIPADAFGPVLAEATAAAIKEHRDIDSTIAAASNSASRFASAPNQEGGQVLSPDAQEAAVTIVARYLHSAVNLNRATGPDREKALGGDKAVAIAAGLAAGIAAYVDRKPPADPSISPEINRTDLLAEIRQRTVEATKKAGGMQREAVEATHISILACLILEEEVKGFEQQDRTPANAVDWATAIIKRNPADDAVISAAMKDPDNTARMSGPFAQAQFHARTAGDIAVRINRRENPLPTWQERTRTFADEMELAWTELLEDVRRDGPPAVEGGMSLVKQLGVQAVNLLGIPLRYSAGGKPYVISGPTDSQLMMGKKPSLWGAIRPGNVIPIQNAKQLQESLLRFGKALGWVAINQISIVTLSNFIGRMVGTGAKATVDAVATHNAKGTTAALVLAPVAAVGTAVHLYFAVRELRMVGIREADKPLVVLAHFGIPSVEVHKALIQLRHLNENIPDEYLTEETLNKARYLLENSSGQLSTEETMDKLRSLLNEISVDRPLEPLPADVVEKQMKEELATMHRIYMWENFGFIFATATQAWMGTGFTTALAIKVAKLFKSGAPEKAFKAAYDKAIGEGLGETVANAAAEAASAAVVSSTYNSIVYKISNNQLQSGGKHGFYGFFREAWQQIFTPDTPKGQGQALLTRWETLPVAGRFGENQWLVGHTQDNSVQRYLGSKNLILQNQWSDSAEGPKTLGQATGVNGILSGDNSLGETVNVTDDQQVQSNKNINKMMQDLRAVWPKDKVGSDGKIGPGRKDFLDYFIAQGRDPRFRGGFNVNWEGVETLRKILHRFLTTIAARNGIYALTNAEATTASYLIKSLNLIPHSFSIAVNAVVGNIIGLMYTPFNSGMQSMGTIRNLKAGYRMEALRGKANECQNTAEVARQKIQTLLGDANKIYNDGINKKFGTGIPALGKDLEKLIRLESTAKAEANTAEKQKAPATAARDRFDSDLKVAVQLGEELKTGVSQFEEFIINKVGELEGQQRIVKELTPVAEAYQTAASAWRKNQEPQAENDNALDTRRTLATTLKNAVSGWRTAQNPQTQPENVLTPAEELAAAFENPLVTLNEPDESIIAEAETRAAALKEAKENVQLTLTTIDFNTMVYKNVLSTLQEQEQVIKDAQKLKDESESVLTAITVAAEAAWSDFEKINKIVQQYKAKTTLAVDIV